MLARVSRVYLFLLCLLGLLSITVAAQSTKPATSSVLAQAQLALDQGDNATAVTLLETLAAHRPDQPGVEHALGLACYRTGRLEQARIAFRHALEVNRNDIDSAQLLGLTLFRMGQPKAAIPYLERAKQWMPSANADASHVLGLCYLDSQQWIKARDAFADEYGLRPDSAAAYLVFAHMLVLSHLPQQGAVEAQKALLLEPHLPMAHLLIGEVDLFDSQVNQAIPEFEAELAINPTYAPVYARLGSAYFRLGRYDRAEQELLKSLALDTSNTGPFILLGQVLLRKHDPVTALLYLRHAEAMDPSSFMDHWLLGQAYQRIGNDKAAKEEFTLASKIQNQSRIHLGPSE